MQAERRVSVDELAHLKEDMKALTNERLPFPLRPLSFDEVFRIDEDGVVSVLFTEVGTHDLPAYEYRIVMRNKTETRTFPEVRILVFNDAGVQVGGADVRESAAWNRPGNPGLSPGEVMTVSGRITLNFDAALRYFVVVRKNVDGSLPKLPF